MRVAALYPALVCTLAASAAVAQSPASATISGVVTDSLGAALPRANVALHSADNHLDRRTVTDANGHFTIAGLPAGRYVLDADATGFATTQQRDVIAAEGTPTELTLALRVSDINQQVIVEADASNSVAAQLAPLDARLDERSARTEIMDHYIRNFTAPTADYAEIIQNAPGAFSINSNGVGLGDAKVYFRGFADGNYDITFDGIPFEDTNSPTHHSWAFFPSPLIGGVDFDRSPGDAATIGPTPFGGSINLLSRPLNDSFNVRGGVSYGSFNTILTNVELDSGKLGANGKTRVAADFNHLTSDGFQTWNAQQRSAGGIKVQYKFSDERVLTGFSGVVLLDTNTPNTKGPTRAQYTTQYNYLLQNTDNTRADYAGYNFYHIPTDFEYVGYKTPLGAKWYLDTKQYTYSYYNQQNYALQPTTGTKLITETNCLPSGIVSKACGVDKLNSYRKYGDTSTFSQVSKYGIARVGLWYEWATTSRHQIPQDPISQLDSPLPNFNEKFITTTYQPFGEYEWHPTSKLALTGGLKYAHYNFDLTQYSDNGGAIGTLPAGVAAVYHTVGYNSVLPSADANYRLKENWSVYAQFATGSVIPPSSVFDVPNVVNGAIIANPVSQPPSPSYAKSYQTGTVLKLKRMTLSGDVFYVRYGNAYTASPDPNAVGANEYQSSGDSVTKGFEGDTNIAIAPGLAIYLNGTVGADRYASTNIASPATGALGRTYTNPNYNAWVANTPSNTETYGITYQRHGFDTGFFTKRIGPMWNDGKTTVPLVYSDGTSKSTSITTNQYIPIDPFDVANLFLNYTVRNASRFNNTKLRLSINNLLDARNITSLTAANTTPTFTQSASDTLGLLAGRSITMSVQFGYGRGR